jgi:glycerol uptake facilitator-like aquaporin
VLAYWTAQLSGAVIAAPTLRGSLGNVAHVGATLPAGSQGQSFLWELVLTFFLMFVILAVATDTRAVGEAAAIAIGGTVGLDAMFAGPISGASMNPARSLGPGEHGRLGGAARCGRQPAITCALRDKPSELAGLQGTEATEVEPWLYTSGDRDPMT